MVNTLSDTLKDGTKKKKKKKRVDSTKEMVEKNSELKPEPKIVIVSKSTTILLIH